MKIFLSWSGDRSKMVAFALRDWLQIVLHYAEPWMSHTDIAAGDRWSTEVGRELAATHFGIICLTRENLIAPWLLFEAGALSKAMEKSAVVPYLFDAEFSDVSGPLAQFQAKKADKPMTLEILTAINARAEKPVEPNRLTTLFQLAWPELERRFRDIPASAAGKKLAPTRTQQEVLEELVREVRGLRQRIDAIEESSAWTTASPATTDIIVVNTMPLLGTKGQTHVLSYSKYSSVSDFLDDLWGSMRNAPPANTYGERWVLRDARSGRTLDDMGRKWSRRTGGFSDDRPLYQAGLLPHQILEVIPPPNSRDAEPEREKEPEEAKGGPPGPGDGA